MITKKNRPAEVKTMFVVSIGSSVEMGFEDAISAGLCATHVMRGLPLKRIYESDASRAPDDEVNVRVTTVRVAFGQGDEYLSVSCDHHIVKDSDVCGISKCYDTKKFADSREIIMSGWMVTEINNKKIVTCPKCVARIKKNEDTDFVDHTMVFHEWCMEQEILERNKREVEP
jgi:hypothetical protein